MLRGEAITWLYTMVLLDAIHMIEKDQQKDSKAVMHKSKWNIDSIKSAIHSFLFSSHIL